MAWSKQLSSERIDAAIATLKSVDVADLVRDTDLSNVPLTKAYRVNGVHVYVEIPNALSLLGVGGTEGEKSHKRLLRFLHLYQRAAHVVLAGGDAMKVDHQNQRLHFVVHKPYDDERKRIMRAVSVANLLREVILGANTHHEELPDAKVCIGIESGITLAVNNGTRGDREPLFIGNAANLAAHLLGPTKEGLFLGDAARKSLGGAWVTTDYATSPLAAAQIASCASGSDFDLTPAVLLKTWEAELKSIPLVDFSFSRPTPPLANLDLDSLSPANSRRLEAAVIIADIDGFTRYVATAMASNTAGAAVRLLHVLRKELRDVLVDFGGRKIRYVGDCLVGVMADGTASETNLTDTVTSVIRCAGALRDAFGVVQNKLPEAAALGLSIGAELGPVAIARLGIKGQMDRVLVGRAVLASQRAQEDCAGNETALGPVARSSVPAALKSFFPKGREQNLTYNKVMSCLDSAAPDVAKTYGVPAPAPAIIIPRAHCR
jgi:class 3 adenylate cyclase